MKTSRRGQYTIITGLYGCAAEAKAAKIAKNLSRKGNWHNVIYQHLGDFDMLTAYNGKIISRNCTVGHKLWWDTRRTVAQKVASMI